MRQSILDLCEILHDEKIIVEGMLELAKEEQRVIVANEPEKLENVIRLQIKELNKLGALEKKRTEVNRQISGEIGVPVAAITITKILETANPNERVQLSNIQKKLTEIIEVHTAINKENRELVKMHVEYSDTVLELVTGADDPLNNMYGGDGILAADQRKKARGFYEGSA